MHHWHFDIPSALIGGAVVVCIATGLAVWFAHDLARVAGVTIDKVVNDAPKR